MKEIIVGVTGINAVDNPGPGIGVVRSLREDPDLKVKIVGLGYDAMEPGFYMDWLIDKSYILPYPSADHTVYLDRLLGIKESYGLDVIIPTLDVELPIFIKNQEALLDHGIKTFLPTMEQFKLRGKDQLLKIADKIGIKLPKTKVITSYSELVKGIEEIGLPVMVKGAHYKAYRAYTTQEASEHMHRIAAEWGYPIIIQEVVHGDELNVVAVGDGEGNSLGAVGIKKMWTTSLGKIWTGVTIKNEAMMEATENFLREYRWKSAFELECILSGDQVYLIEINPRFPAWTYFATGVGINLPANLLRAALGIEPLEERNYPAGKLYVRYTYELISDLDPYQRLTTLGER